MLNIFNELAPAISIILVGFLTWFFDRRDKKNKRIRDLENQKRELEIKAFKEEHQREQKKIYSRIETLEQRQTKVLDSFEEIKEGLDKVIRITLEDRETIESLNTQFNKDHDKIVKMNNKLDDLFDAVEQQNEDLRRLSTNLHNCIIYTQSVANVVTTLAEALRDNHFNSNITETVADFRRKEQEIFTAISETAIVKTDNTRLKHSKNNGK